MKAFDTKESDYDVAVCTAVGVSSRFPFLLPAAREGNRRLVDGGYYDNSGVESARALLRHLEDELVVEVTSGVVTLKVEIDPRLLIVAGEFPGEFEHEEDEKPYGLSEMLSPFRTMMSVREWRGNTTVQEVIHNALNSSARPKAEGIAIWHKYFPLPLGFKQSEIRYRLISASLGRPGNCRNAREKAFGTGAARRMGLEGLLSQIEENSCTLRCIIGDIAMVYGEPMDAACGSQQ